MTDSGSASRVLPPAVSDQRFERAMQAFARCIGGAWVLTSPRQLQDYLDPFAFGNAHEHAPSAAIRPGSVEEVQAVVRVANEYGIPLWTVSRGRNYGYGGAAPRLRGSVVVDLGRMNRILEVDERSAYVLLEPGVSFMDLYAHLRAGGHRLWVSAPALGWGSVVGNALERGLGSTAYADHEHNVCGMEVVLANGELLRTGMGAMPGSASWQLNKAGFGPSADGLFMQSNFGIVTKMGLWLMPTPESFHICQVKFQHDSDLGPLVETLRPFKVDGTIPSRAISVNAIRVAQAAGPRSQWYDGPGAVPDDVIRQIRGKLDIGAWNLIFGLYGADAVVETQLRAVRAAFGRIAGAEFASRKYAGDVGEGEVETRHRLYAGIPGMEHLAILSWAGPNGAHLGFSPISPLTAEHAVRQARMVRATSERFGFDYGTAFGALGRHLNHIFMIVFDRTNEDETTRARALFDALVREGAAEGYGEYRTHLAYMDLVAAQYSFNDHAQMRFNERLKDALDPNGILAPGKQGIWPRSLRAPRAADERETPAS